MEKNTFFEISHFFSTWSEMKKSWTMPIISDYLEDLCDRAINDLIDGFDKGRRLLYRVQ